MHVDVSFSYLRSAATASFDKKEFHRNCTITLQSAIKLTRIAHLMVEGEEGGILLEHGHTVSAGLRVQLFVDVPEM